MSEMRSRPKSNRNRKKRKKKGVFNPGTSHRPSYGSSISQEESRSKYPKYSKPESPKQFKKSEPHQRKYAGDGNNSKNISNIDPVELFSAYHLGITQNNQYKPQNIHDVARRFRTSPGRIKQALADNGLDSESVMSKDFDMGMAQLDIKVAPEGISKIELGKQLYKEFLEAPILNRNWEEELKNDAEANRNIYEKLK